MLDQHWVGIRKDQGQTDDVAKELCVYPEAGLKGRLETKPACPHLLRHHVRGDKGKGLSGCPQTTHAVPARSLGAAGAADDA